MKSKSSEGKKELKFRAWDKENKQWIEEFLITSDQDVLVVGEYETIKTGLTNGWKSSDGLVELQQYTGLKDKNGVEIYEGDIVEQRNSITGITQYYEIMWSNDDCGFIGKGKKDSLFNGLGIISKELEIIGNIYEK